MTEKRFRAIYCDDYAMDYITDNGKQMHIDDVVECLNTLHEENEQLKSDATTLIYHNQEYRKEIESLKEENKFLQNKIATYKTGNRLLKKTLDKEMK